ncbi:MAG: hypothetical protein RXP30_05820 [Thermoplasmata archaeon]|nr:hypothetical protein [Euryarchaeota archaeon]
MVIALVPVGKSKRLENKHFLDYCGKRIIDSVVDNLINSGLFSKIVIYSYFEFNIDRAEIIIDKKLQGVLPLIIDAMERYSENIFVLGGDMPLATYFSPLLSYPEQLSVIPRWKNGYIEPLHSLYSISSLNYYSGERALHDFIEKIPRVYYPAEKMPEYSFYNINTREDYSSLIKKCNGNL